MKFFCPSVWQSLCSSQNLFSFDIHYSLFDIRYSKDHKANFNYPNPLKTNTHGLLQLGKPRPVGGVTVHWLCRE
jgi:hypothetical protein